MSLFMTEKPRAKLPETKAEYTITYKCIYGCGHSEVGKGRNEFVARLNAGTLMAIHYLSCPNKPKIK